MTNPLTPCNTLKLQWFPKRVASVLRRPNPYRAPAGRTNSPTAAPKACIRALPLFAHRSLTGVADKKSPTLSARCLDFAYDGLLLLPPLPSFRTDWVPDNRTPL